MYYNMYYAIVTYSIAYELLDGYASSHFYPRTLTIHPLLFYFILLLHLFFGLPQSLSFCSRRAISQPKLEIIKCQIIPKRVKEDLVIESEVTKMIFRTRHLPYAVSCYVRLFVGVLLLVTLFCFTN